MNKLITLLLFWMLISIIACDQVKKAEIKDMDGYLIETFEFIGDSIRHGMSSKYISNKLNEQSIYQNGKLEGARKVFFDNGNVEIEELYVNGVLNGPHKIYYDDGSLHIESEFIDGSRQGILKRYYKNGQLWEEVTFVDNEENGPFKEYYESGKVQWAGTFKDGDNEVGELLQYDEEGALIKKMICDEMSVCQTVWTKEKGDIAIEKLELSHEKE